MPPFRISFECSAVSTRHYSCSILALGTQVLCIEYLFAVTQFCVSNAVFALLTALLYKVTLLFE